MNALHCCQPRLSVCLAAVPAGQYMFEKLLSGLYLGEVARRMLLRLCAGQ
jgi:hexokinase